jgi:hypothetical protein
MRWIIKRWRRRNSSPPPPPALVSYVGTTGVFAAWADANSGNSAFAPMGTYAAKKQSLHGSVDFMTGTNLSQPAGIEVYKGGDGHIYALNLTSTSTPQLVQRKSTSASEGAACILGVQCALLSSSFTRVWSVIQFTSHVLPPSSENDCSKWGESVSVFDQRNRTKTDLPFGPDGSVS